MSSGPHIDPRLYPQQHSQQQHHQPYAPNLDQVRRQQLPQPHQHLPPPNSRDLSQRPQHDIHHSPQQPYYLPPGQQRSHPPPPHHGQTYDPVLEQHASSVGDIDDHGSPGDEGAQIGPDGKPIDPKRARACDSCRGLKVKCDFSENTGPNDTCKRCAKARRACIVTPATRRRQKKADGRVAELERKVEALTQRLTEQDPPYQDADAAYTSKVGKRSASPYGTSPSSRFHDPNLDNKFNPEKKRRLSRIDSTAVPNDRIMKDGQLTSTSSSEPQSANGNFGLYNETKGKIFDHSDIDQKISRWINHTQAEYLFNRYVHQISPAFPAVIFPSGTSAEQVRRTKPILYLAILSSTCYGAGIPQDIQEGLEESLREVLADSIWKKGEKSLEIIQALQVATLWYRPPHNFDQHMFYQMVHCSAIMAVDIGIGKKIAPARRKYFEQPRAPASTQPHPESAEVRRAWLTSYFLCTSISMILRRSILVRYNDYMKDCIDYLESGKAEDGQPSDRILCQHVRIAHISEDVTGRFSMDDPTVALSIADSQVTYGIKTFEEALNNLLQNDGNYNDLGLKLSEHVTSLYLHEIALHSQANVEEFKTPFMDQTFKGGHGGESTLLGPQHVAALTACQHACRSLLDNFLASEIDTVYALPILFSVRCIYSVVVLIKLYMAAKGPGEMSSIIKSEDLHVGDYIERLRQTFGAFVDRDSQCPHSKFHLVMKRLGIRFGEIERGEAPAAVEGAQAVAAAQAAAKGIGQTIGGVFNEAGAQVAAMSPTSKRNASTNHPNGPKGLQPTQAGGLHLLSEVAMGNNNQPGSHASRQQQPPQQQQGPHQQQPQQQQQGWYPGAGGPTDMGGVPMDPHAYGAYQQMPMMGFEGFDYGLGSLGMGVDGAISGLFMADGLWDVGSYGQMHQGWA